MRQANATLTGSQTPRMRIERAERDVYRAMTHAAVAPTCSAVHINNSLAALPSFPSVGAFHPVTSLFSPFGPHESVFIADIIECEHLEPLKPDKQSESGWKKDCSGLPKEGMDMEWTASHQMDRKKIMVSLRHPKRLVASGAPFRAGARDGGHGPMTSPERVFALSPIIRSDLLRRGATRPRRLAGRLFASENGIYGCEREFFFLFST
ncbi:hypothetical protein EVAR_84806_1 [Eumeta japonica]|uniref:Uncharacterized protein n=1 Tax=Eumeta variegata TaxID=151549 RepID=A0A4C1U9J4_EUMVA|nr:hypothetical protein EVAR_84806_1 [Eumeta japonica]